MPTEVYSTRANTLPVKEVWMVSDVCGKIRQIDNQFIVLTSNIFQIDCGKIKGMKID